MFIDADGANISAIWSNNLNGAFTVKVVSSSDGGKTFSDPETIWAGLDWALPLQLEVNGNSIIALWLIETSSGSDLFVSRSNDSGFSFSTPTNVTRSPDTASNLAGSMVTQGGRITVAWGEDDGLAGIFATTSFDGGLTFGDVIRLSKVADSLVGGPKLVAGPTNIIYAAWQKQGSEGQGIDFTRSTDNGLSFASADTVLPGHCCFRDLLAHQDMVFLNSAWEPLVVSADQGMTWESRNPGITTLYRTAHSGSVFHIGGWEWDAENETQIVKIASSDDGGATFEQHVLGTTIGQCGWSRATSAYGEVASTAWEEAEPGTTGCSVNDIRNLVLRSTSNGGQTFGPRAVFPVGLSGQYDPFLFVDQSRISIVWTSYATGSELDAPLNFSWSTDGGLDFDTVLIASGLTQLQSIAFNAVNDGQLVHIVTDTTDGVVIITEYLDPKFEMPIFEDGFE